MDHFVFLINKWKELKGAVEKNIVQDSENLLLRAEVAEMKAIISQLQCSVRLFKETPVTAQAYKILNLILDENLLNVNDATVEKYQQMKNYEALRGTEYDRILKKYLELNETIEKKKNLLEKL